MNIEWGTVLVLTLINAGWVGVLIATKWIVVRRTVERAVAEQMGKAVAAISKRLDASEVYLTAAEQHTALLGDWEAQRKADHDRRQAESVRMFRGLIQQELEKKLKAATATVVSEVQQVPAQVVTELKKDSDSQDGSTTKAPAYQPPPGAVS